MSKGFFPEDGDSINCPSTWQSKRSCQESSAQTADLTYVEKGSQSKSSSNAEIQTEAAGGKSSPTVDLAKLAAWLTRITPKVLDELDKNHKSRVFDDYKLQETTDDSIKLMFSLDLEEDHPQFRFQTSAIDWSSTGGMLAVSRCAKEHTSWCEHSGCVLLHQINRHEAVVKTPHASLDVSACVTALCSHPSDSFILACGTFSGEVVVWNLQRDDPMVIGNITLHTEAVVHMEWVQNFDMMQTRPILVSAARDGSIVIWSSKTVSGTLKPSICFVLKTEKDALDIGIVCTKFNPSKPTMFLVGLEGGSVAVCSSDSRRPCIGKKSAIGQDLDCYDPVLHILDGHKGAVTGVQWIPNSKDLFLTCGTDSELRVYSSSELNVIRIIYLSKSACGLEVCPSHPHVALTWGSSGAVELHNVFSEKKLSSLELENDGVPVSAIGMRTASCQLLALGNAVGRVSVWQIPHSKFLST